MNTLDNPRITARRIVEAFISNRDGLDFALAVRGIMNAAEADVLYALLNAVDQAIKDALKDGRL